MRAALVVVELERWPRRCAGRHDMMRPRCVAARIEGSRSRGFRDGSTEQTAAVRRKERPHMDATKFDAVVRRLASGITRRQTLRGLMAGAVTAVAGGTALKEAAAGQQ